jgi:prohibitin 2
MKPPKNWRKILLLVLFILFIVQPKLFPLIIFFVIILLSTSDEWKKYFDNEDIEKNETKDSDTLQEKKEKLTDKYKTYFFTKKPMNFMKQDTDNNFPQGKTGILLVFLFLLIISVVIDGVKSIPAGHVGVVFSKLNGGVQDEVMNPGINFKLPFLESVTILDTRMQEKTINASRDPIEALTKDGQKVGIDITVQYNISQETAPKIVQKIGMDYEKKIITPGVRSVVRKVITGYDSTDLFKQETRVKAEQEIVEQLKGDYDKNHITLINTLVRDVKFSDKYLDAIEEKKIAEQKIQKSEFEKKNAAVQADKKIIEARAEAESIKLKGEALSKSPEIIQLQFVEKMAPQINWGILPDGAIPMIDVKSLSEQSK